MESKDITIKFSGNITNRQLLIVLLTEQANIKSRILLIERMLRDEHGISEKAYEKQLAALVRDSFGNLDRRVKEYSDQS
jgi:hypothetical protein